MIILQNYGLVTITVNTKKYALLTEQAMQFYRDTALPKPNKPQQTYQQKYQVKSQGHKGRNGGEGAICIAHNSLHC